MVTLMAGAQMTAEAISIQQSVSDGSGIAGVERLAQTEVEVEVDAEAQAEFLAGIFKGLVRKAVGSRKPHIVCGGSKNVDGQCVAFDHDPVISYISTHHIKPKVRHTTI